MHASAEMRAQDKALSMSPLVAVQSSDMIPIECICIINQLYILWNC